MRELPLFSLHTVLFPGGSLPLRVFEKRYRDMVTACLKDECEFGICLIQAGEEVGKAASPHRVGTTARIVACDVAQPGILSVTVRGGERFRVVRTRVQPDQLLLGTVERLPEPEHPAPLGAAHRELGALLARLIEQLGERYEFGRVKLDDASWVAYRLAELLPLGNALRQQVLERPDAEDRLELLQQALAPGRPADG